MAPIHVDTFIAILKNTQTTLENAVCFNAAATHFLSDLSALMIQAVSCAGNDTT